MHVYGVVVVVVVDPAVVEVVVVAASTHGAQYTSPGAGSVPV